MLEANVGVSKLHDGGNAHVRAQRLEAVGLGGEGVGALRRTLLEEIPSQK